jgi:hypothetical protein
MASNRLVVFGVGLVAALAGGGVVAAEGADAVRLARGRLVSASAPAAGPAAALETGRPLEFGSTYDVVGSTDASLSGPGGLALRALAGTRLRADRGPDGALVVVVDRGSLADAAAASPFSVVTPTARVASEGARFSVRSTPEGTYVEHRAGSPGRLSVAPYGGAAAPLAAGSFRMVGLVSTPAPGPAVAAPAVAPAGYAAPPVPAASSSLPAPSATYAYVAPPPRVAPTALAPATLAANGAPPPPPPVASDAFAPVPTHPCGPNCGRLLRTPPPPVPVRADDYGRVPLGSAMPGGPCCNRADVECNRVPYVRYVEGLVCDVATYKLGYRLVTVRPASRVRVHRLPDGSLQMWAPNIGKDLALIELDWNQFAFIGEDGFLVLSADGQVEYFRGLVHLWHHKEDPQDCLYKGCRPFERQTASGIREVLCE